MTLLFFTGILAACLPHTSPTIAPTTPKIHKTPAETASSSASPTNQPTELPTLSTPQPLSDIVGYTHIAPNGNRIVTGKGSLPGGRMIDLPLISTPAWVLGAPINNGRIWVVKLEDGNFQAFKEVEGTFSSIAFYPQTAPKPGPFTLHVRVETITDYTIPITDLSPFVPAIPLSGLELAAGVLETGDLVLFDNQEATITRFPLEVLPDARILSDGQHRVLVLSGATDRYKHGVLGDSWEAGSISLIQAAPSPEILGTITLADDVVEGLAPIWADMDQDGQLEILVTLSNSDTGARLVVFEEGGEVLASSDALGTGFRWRHQIAAGPLGPNGEFEIVSVRTPHLGGVVEYHRLSGNQLVQVASLPGYASHEIGSRNLDLAAAADFDGDGNLEVLIPNQRKDTLAAIQRQNASAQVIWSLPIHGTLSTNLAVTPDAAGHLAVAVGRQDNTLRIWFP